MASSLRERRRLMLRDEIIEATHQLMAEKGYGAFSMEELAARVGVSKPTLYSHFPTRDDLVAAMATQLLERTFASVAAEPDASPLERLLRFLHTSVRIQIERRSHAMQLWMPEVIDILERHPASQEYICRMDEGLVATIHAAIEAGEIDPSVDIAAVVRVFYALNISPSLGRLSVTGEPDPDALANLVVAIFRRGLARPQGPAD